MEPKIGRCCTCGYENTDKVECPKRNVLEFNFDSTHCEHWWEGSEESEEEEL